MSYVVPCNAPISDNYQAHKNRNSAEPGTDYACAYGTDIVAAGNGTVVVVHNSSSGAAGRRVTIDLDDGRRVSYIHLSHVYATVAQRVRAGQVIAKSGASGFGKDWYYGPHVHVSLWERPGLSYADTIDFEKYLSSGDGEMIIFVKGKAGVRNGGLYLLKDNKRHFLGANRGTGFPEVTDETQIVNLFKIYR